MAQIGRPKRLAVQTGISPGSYSNVFAPSGSLSWEVNTIIATQECAIERALDTDGDGTFDTFVEVERGPAGEFHAYKFQVDSTVGIRVKNLGSSAMTVALLGEEIS